MKKRTYRKINVDDLVVNEFSKKGNEIFKVLYLKNNGLMLLSDGVMSFTNDISDYRLATDKEIKEWQIKSIFKNENHWLTEV